MGDCLKKINLDPTIPTNFNKQIKNFILSSLPAQGRAEELDTYRLLESLMFLAPTLVQDRGAIIRIIHPAYIMIR